MLKFFEKCFSILITHIIRAQIFLTPTITLFFIHFNNFLKTILISDTIYRGLMCVVCEGPTMVRLAVKGIEDVLESIWTWLVYLKCCERLVGWEVVVAHALLGRLTLGTL